jgi:putative transposase
VSPCRRKSAASTRHAHVNHLQIVRSTSLQETCTQIDAILALAREWGEIDASHRKLAHRGSYLGRVWVSPSTVLRVLLAYGQALPFRPARQRSVKRPWPDWVDYKPLQVWGYDFSAFTAAQTSALAILDLVSRKWIDTMLCPEATDVPGPGAVHPRA